MANNRSPNDRYNESGYYDETAYTAIENVRREERRKLISEIKELAYKRGYKIVSTIDLKEIGGDENVQF